ncbi:hypothetical protein JCM11491_003166 [Sporobolomyces phaffii]
MRPVSTASLVLSIIALDLALEGYAISIAPAFPSTPVFDAALASLTTTADALTRRHAAPRLHHRRLAGTAIDDPTDFDALQAYLDCTAADGEWRDDPLGTSLARLGTALPVHKMDSKFATCDKQFYKRSVNGDDEQDEGNHWNVRQSLKYHFVPSPTCASLLPAHLRLDDDPASMAMPSRTRLCQLLAHKSVLLLGSTTQYSLHDLLLDFLTTRPQSCYGDLYCKEHALCGGILNDDGHPHADDETRRTAVENWSVDERVYHQLPSPPVSPLSPPPTVARVPRADSPPGQSSSSIYASSTHSTLLRYRRTDGLRPRTADTAPTYQHAFTGLHEANQPWLADARRSDVVVLEKAPVPLPLRRHNTTFDEWFYDYLDDADNGNDDVDGVVERLVDAVRDVTERVWLPELVEAVESIRSSTGPRRDHAPLVVYRSGWRTHYDCAGADADEDEGSEWDSPGDGPLRPLRAQPGFDRLVYRTGTGVQRRRQLQPLDAVYHNLQVVVQNELARRVVLPAFGVAYLDLETRLSVWRTGLLGGASPSGPRGMRSATSGDCHRYCWPSPGLAVEGAFVGALERLFEVAWVRAAGGGGDRAREWVGDEFRNLRMRLNDPA